MGAYVLIAIVAILVWGVLRFNREHNRANQIATEDREALIEAQEERDELRKRVQVLERIVTDENTPDAKKTKQLASEIESLRRLEGSTRSKNTEDMSE